MGNLPGKTGNKNGKKVTPKDKQAEDERRREKNAKKRQPKQVDSDTDNSAEARAERARSKKGKSIKKTSSKKRRNNTDSSTSSTDTEPELESTEVAASNWSLLASIWPVRDRPDNLQREDVVNAIAFDTLLAMAKFQKETRVGSATSGSKSSFTKDTLPNSTLFKEQRDNGVKKLHEARFLRLPLTDPKKWWDKMPLTRSHKYRNIPLKFMGCQGQIAEKTIENTHDRAVAH